MGLEGIQLGHYRIRNLIARGGMGEIYLADDTHLPRQVAIKVVQSEPSLYPNATEAQESSRLFEREMRMISTLDHPYILQLLDYGTENVQGKPTTYMVMPYRPEGSFIDWLRKRGTTEPLPIQDVAHFIREAADALQHAHDRGILHMDVKPSNFLLRNRQEAPNRPDLLLSDFGISRATGTSKGSTTARGTMAYMATEQWNGHPVAASDQYSLAIMAYELLTGRLPFQGNDVQIMYQHVQAQPSPPSTLNPRVPTTLDAVILRALAKNPQDRFPSIRLFADAFQQAAASNAGFAASSYTPPPPPPPNQNQPWQAPTPTPNQWQGTPTPIPANQYNQWQPTPTPTPPPNNQYNQWQGTPAAPNQWQTPGMAPLPTQPQRKNNTGLIVLITLGALVVLIGGIVLAGTLNRSTKNNNTVNGGGGVVATTAPTNTPVPTATPGVTPAATSSTKLVLDDPLSSNQHNWDESTSCVFNADGTYHVLENRSNYLFYCLAQDTNFSRFAYEVDMKILSGDAGGIAFCADSAAPSYYYFRVTANGQYALYRYSKHQSTTVVGDSNSTAIRQGTNQTNTVGVVDFDGSIALYINGTKVVTTTDANFTQGKIGVVANDMGQTTEVSFSNVKVYQ